MPENSKIQVIVVLGPTASGKTWLGVELAKLYNGEIISADSMQIYKDMRIGTAKPDDEEKCGIPHYMMDFLPTDEKYSVAEYVKAAKEHIDNISARGKLPIIVGGTGLYITSLLENISFSECNEDEALRKQLTETANLYGVQRLYDELYSFDPESAERIGTGNVKRLIRAIEIYRTSGITMTEQIKNSKLIPSPYEAFKAGLKCEDRAKLYDRINKRVDNMMQDGLLDETRQVLKMQCSNTSAMAIGYKELIPYLNGKCTLEEAVERLKTETRHYAKRQLTWFMRDKAINWFDIDTFDTKEALLNAVCKSYENYKASL